MKKEGKSRRRRSEEGIALLIAIFVLLLISVVAIALLVSSGTETALGANYRASSTVYYAALAGLEEARGRLLPKNQNYFGASTISPTSTFPLGQTLYVTNAATGGETVAPWDSSNAFFDTQYQSEFGVPASSASWQSFPSVWNNNAQGIPGPVFKWVRINAVSENSLYMDVNQNGTMDSSYPLFYDPAHLDGSGNPAPSLIWSASPPSTPTAVQSLEITALAALPNGSQKLLQYLVAPLPVDITPIAPNQRFLAALTLDGNNVSYQGPNTGAFKIVGDDNTVGRTCSAATIPSVPAIGYTNSSDSSNVSSGTSYFPSNYRGNQPPLALPPAPSVARVLPPPIFQTPSRVDGIAQSVIQNADVTIPSGPVSYPLSTVDGAALSAATPTMSPSNPLTVVVNGNLDLTSWHNTGYGLLLVTGNLNYDPDAYWDGIVMVIGQGTIIGSHSGIGQINGAVFVAQTRDSSGNLLSDPNLGSASVQFASSMGGSGIRMDSCWVSAALAPVTYKVLSFHEVPQ